MAVKAGREEPTRLAQFLIVSAENDLAVNFSVDLLGTDVRFCIHEGVPEHA